MKHRFKVQAYATGGGVEPHNPPVTEAYAGGSSNVAKEARQLKRGGRIIERADGGHVEEADERKTGGRVKRKFGGAIAGAKAAARADRPGRKGGGRVGADTAPFSSNARASSQKLAEQH
jgi:hypothetical protein